MGIDIYARWDGQPEGDLIAQAESWCSNEGGEIGYLREAYHGEPYATRYFVSEAFENLDGAYISADTLRERMPETIRLAEQRERQVYGASEQKDIEGTLENIRQFVECCEELEQATGKPVKIIASW